MLSTLLAIFKRNHWKDSAKFVFVLKTYLDQMISRIHTLCSKLGIMNAIIVTRQSELMIFNSDYFTKSNNLTMHDAETLEVAFPDKLKNMTGIEFRAIVYGQKARIQLVQDFSFDGVDIQAMKLIASHRNATVKLVPLLANSADAFLKLLRDEADMLLVTAIYYRTNRMFWRQIMTYDENGHCALIPIPPRLSFLHYLLTPFDLLSWFMILLTVMLCSTVYKLSKGRSSIWKFIFKVIANFIGQSAEVKTNRKLQMVLIKLCVLMTFIMGTSYQSLIVVYMTSSREGDRFKNFEEFFKSDMKFTASEHFVDIINSTVGHSVISRLHEKTSVLSFSDLKGKNIAVIQSCEMARFQFEEFAYSDFSSRYYLMPDQIMPYFEKISLKIFSPFYSLLQNYFDRIFESGIRQHIKSRFDIVGMEEKSLKAKFTDNEEYLLTMYDVHGLFYILVGGYLVSLSAFFLEICNSALRKKYRSRVSQA